MKKFSLIILLPLLASQTALANNFFIGYSIGSETINIIKKYNLENNHLGNSEDLFSQNINLGYQFDNGVLAEIGHRSSGSFNILGAFDDLSLSSTYGSVGYTLNSGNFSWVPNVNIAQSELKLKEGAFLNPGDEKSQKTSDIAKGIGLNGYYSLNESFDLSAKAKLHTSKFGDTKSLHLGIRYNFKSQ